MPLTTATVTGYIPEPDGVTYDGDTTVTFTLNKADFDTEDDATVIPTPKTITLDGSGEFSVDLWPNERGSQGSKYFVDVAVTDTEVSPEQREFRLGYMQVPNAGGDMADLMGLGTQFEQVFASVITEAQYDAAIAAVNAAETAADRAEAATSVMVVDTFEGDGATATFELSVTPQGTANVKPSIDGLVQHVDAFTLSGKFLTFTDTPPDNAKIQVSIFAVNVTDPEFPDYPSPSALAQSTTLISGRIYSAAEAFNGQKEDFIYRPDSTLTPNNGTVLASASGGNLESLRTVYADWAEFDADPRDNMVGQFVTVEGLIGGYTVVSSGEDITLSGGLKVILATFGPVTTHHFGGVGDKVADDTAALNAAISYCKAKGVPLRDRVDRWFRITDPDGIWLGSTNTANPCRGVSTNIVIDTEGGRGFDLTGIQNGHRDEYDLRVETASGITACYGFIQARPYRTASTVYSSGNAGKMKLWFAGDAYGPAYYNVASESNVVQSVFLSNRSGLSSAWCKDDYFAGKSVAALSDVSTFTIGETLTGGTSGATAKLLRADESRIFLESISGSFTSGETLTGGTSAASIALDGEPYEFGTASAFTAIQDGFSPSTSTFQAIRDMWANNGSADKLWPTVLVRSFASIVFDTPNVNTTDGGDLFEFHGDCSPVVNFGYLHGVHRYSLVFGDVHDATSQVVVRGKFVGLNAGNVTARVKTATDLVRFEDCVFDLEGDLDFGGTALNGHTEIRLGAYAITASGRLEGYLFYDSQGGSDLSGITSGPTDNRMRKSDTSSTVQNGFTAMTGTSRKGALDTSTVTLVQLAERVRAIEAAALAAGVILPA